MLFVQQFDKLSSALPYKSQYTRISSNKICRVLTAIDITYISCPNFFECKRSGLPFTVLMGPIYLLGASLFTIPKLNRCRWCLHHSKALSATGEQAMDSNPLRMCRDGSALTDFAN